MDFNHNRRIQKAAVTLDTSPSAFDNDQLNVLLSRVDPGAGEDLTTFRKETESKENGRYKGRIKSFGNDSRSINREFKNAVAAA